MERPIKNYCITEFHGQTKYWPMRPHGNRKTRIVDVADLAMSTDSNQDRGRNMRS